MSLDKDKPRLNVTQKTQKIVKEMSNLQTLTWIGVALLVHVVVIFGVSHSYFLDKLDPGRVAQREKAALAAKDAAEKGNASAGNSAQANNTPSENEPGEEAAMNRIANTKIGNELSETAPAPKIPASGGIDFGEDPLE